MKYLEDWALLDRGYSSSLSGAIEALKASTLRLPVVGGAKEDVLNVKDAICSAMDVMQAMASSICLLSPKVGQVNSLLFEAANLSSKELALLEECKNLLSIIAALQLDAMARNLKSQGFGHSDCVHSIDLSDCDSDSISDNLVSTNSDIMAGEQANHHTLKELGAPDVNYQPLCIQYPDLAANFELKSGLIHLLPKFHGLAGECPIKHLKEFHVVCGHNEATCHS
ncbi:hypothetical protein K1719_018860 [Acacia pycnantha]|nr:hypothetical protein K1719_018860 [Acacia pycnantha]